MDDAQFGQLIRHQRLALRLSAATVAKAVGITPAYLSMLETGRNPTTKRPPKPSFDVVARLAAVLGLEVANLNGAAGMPSLGHQVSFAAASGSRAPTRRTHGETHRSRSPVALRKKVPSGISGVDIRHGSHVLLLSASRSSRDVELTLDFARAGLRNRETSVIRLPPEWSSARATRRFGGDPGVPLDRLVLRPWQDSVMTHYRPHRFSRDEAIAAHTRDLQLARHPRGGRLRYVAPDSSAYLRWLNRRTDVSAVLDYEQVWPSDMQLLVPDGITALLCLYRMRDLAATASGALP